MLRYTVPCFLPTAEQKQSYTRGSNEIILDTCTTQSITIYKLRDNETNEEFLEFDESIAFQTACKECVNIKTCIDAGHELVDWWPPKIVGDQAEGTPLDPDPPTDEETVSNTIPASTTTSNSVNRSINNSNTKKKRAKKGNKSPAQGNVGKGSRSTSASSLSSRDGSGSPASGAATAAPAANGNVTWSGGTSGDGRGKGKVKAAAGQQVREQAMRSHMRCETVVQEFTSPLWRGGGGSVLAVSTLRTMILLGFVLAPAVAPWWTPPLHALFIYIYIYLHGMFVLCLCACVYSSHPLYWSVMFVSLLRGAQGQMNGKEACLGRKAPCRQLDARWCRGCRGHG